MNNLSLLFESPPWLVLVGILMGIAYAGLLYLRNKAPWGKNINYMLAMLRFVMVSLLTLLLFGPLIRQLKNTKEAPAIVFAIDNSQSISEIEDSSSMNDFQNKIIALQHKLNDYGYLTDIRTLHGKAQQNDKIKFNAQSSDLNKMLLGIQNDFESRNLSNVILFSDGLYNLGSNPVFRPYNFPISTIGLGDTTQRPDLNLNAILFNKIAFQGNKFPIVAELLSYNLGGKNITVQVKENGKVIDQKQVKIINQNQFDQVEFIVDAATSGMKRFTISALPTEGEHIIANNSKEAFIDIINGKQKILIVAPAPHPDIKAIKSALESNKNYEVITYINGINKFVEDKYDAVVLHQVPDKKRKYTKLLNKIIEEKIPAFFIFGSQSDLTAFNKINGAVRIFPINNQQDNVFPFYNQDFGKFLYDKDYVDRLNKFSPVKAPFANYDILPRSEVMLFQKVGRINTNKPLMLIQKSNEWSSAIFIGDGIWNWRLQEYAKNQTHKAFDEMISKIVQYLSTKEDKRKFRVYPVKNELLNSEPVIFETEVYNDIFEQTYGHKIDLIISDDQNNTKSYSYVTSDKNSSYKISGMENGIFKYTARTIIKGKTETVSGTFTVNDLQIETTKLTADHNLLRNVASLNNGEFYEKDQLDQLEEDLQKQELVIKIYTSEKFLSIINMKWGFFILLALVSAEWFIRKYHGSY